MSVINVETFEQLENAVNTANDYVVIDFYATWCGPCKMMAPIFESVSESVEDVTFVKCLVDDMTQFRDLSNIPALTGVQVRSIPYFVMISKENSDVLFSKNGTMNAPTLENLIESSK